MGAAITYYGRAGTAVTDERRPQFSSESYYGRKAVTLWTEESFSTTVLVSIYTGVLSAIDWQAWVTTITGSTQLYPFHRTLLTTALLPCYLHLIYYNPSCCPLATPSYYTFFAYIGSAAPSASFNPLCNLGFPIATRITTYRAAGTNNNFTVSFDSQFHNITNGKLPSLKAIS
jgi:hypothetical protein